MVRHDLDASVSAAGAGVTELFAEGLAVTPAGVRAVLLSRTPVCSIEFPSLHFAHGAVVAAGIAAAPGAPTAEVVRDALILSAMDVKGMVRGDEMEVGSTADTLVDIVSLPRFN